MASSYDLCLDGIFGFQFRPPMDAATADLIAKVNAHPSMKLRASVDLPSGLDADAGIPGDPTVRADVTVTFFAKKIGFARDEAQATLGRLFVVDIGEPAALRTLFESDR